MTVPIYYILRVEKFKISKDNSFVRYLRQKFLEKQKQNRLYSITAFARDLGVSQPFISRLLNGQRAATVKFAIQAAALFGVSKKTTDEWISSIILSSSKNAKISKKIRQAYEAGTAIQSKSVIHYEADRFKIISQWYHLAILYLTYTDNFQENPKWISARLGISALEAKDALYRLLDLGLLEKRNGKLISTHNVLVVDPKKTELSVREFHKQTGLKALEELNHSSATAFERRYMGGVTLAIDKERVPEFKAKLKEFEKEILNMVSSKNYTDVYQLNLQFFPLTKQETQK